MTTSAQLLANALPASVSTSSGSAAGSSSEVKLTEALALTCLPESNSKTNSGTNPSETPNSGSTSNPALAGSKPLLPMSSGKIQHDSDKTRLIKQMLGDS